MHRSSDTIGNISGALAKAQAELTNPEKSLVATIRSPFPVKPTAPSAMPRCRAGWILSVRALAGTRSRLSSRRISIKRPAFFGSRPFLRIRRANGSRRNGRCARCPMSHQRSAWAPRSPMRGGMLFSRLWALPARMISMRPISAPVPIPHGSCRDHRIMPQGTNGQPASAQRKPAGDGKVPGPSATSVLGEQLSASLRESLLQQMAAINSGGRGGRLGASESPCQEHADTRRRQNCRGAVSGEAQ